MANINHIPAETLVHIFSYYLETENQRTFVDNISKVCPTWKQVAFDSSLWKTFDGTLPFSHFERMCKQGILTNTREVKFSKEPKSVEKNKKGKSVEKNKKGKSVEKTKTPKSVKNIDLSEIYTNLPSVRRINFSNVALQERFFTNLEDKCPELCEIIISDEKMTCPTRISYMTFSNFFTLRGFKITHLDFSFSHILSLNKLFFVIGSTCPNLEELLAQNLDPSSSAAQFPIENVQEGCPKLKILRLGFPIRYTSKSRKSCPGFPELEVFTHSAMNDFEFTDESLLRLLFLSDKLKVLDLRGCGLLTAGKVCSLPANDLERLFISRAKMNCSKDSKKLLQKWCHSLIQLDISKNDLEEINDILYSVVPSNGMPKLESLTISFTKLSVPLAKLIIINCLKLTYLQVEGCRRIGRSLMHAYHGREALNNLLLKLNCSS